MRRTYYTNLPCFPGFYESLLSPDVEDAVDALVEYHSEGDGFFRHRLPPKLVTRYFELAEEERLISFNYEGYQDSCARRFCAVVKYSHHGNTTSKLIELPATSRSTPKLRLLM